MPITAIRRHSPSRSNSSTLSDSSWPVHPRDVATHNVGIKNSIGRIAFSPKTSSYGVELIDVL